ncbi:hypothetical protein EAO70_07170 [Streptomyces sp. adm13(2018)]|nr:hypothetical protein EAO70_07170 [Streptomyces sp. adm13(2018)]
MPFKRLRTRYERRADLPRGLLHLARSLAGRPLRLPAPLSLGCVSTRRPTLQRQQSSPYGFSCAGRGHPSA